MVASKYLKYIGPTMTDVNEVGAIISFKKGDIFRRDSLEDLGNGFYRDTRFSSANGISKSYFKPYYPYLIHILISLIMLSIVIYIKSIR